MRSTTSITPPISVTIEPFPVPNGELGGGV